MRINCHTIGRGRPLILLHGIGLSWRSWEPVLELLARTREVRAIDLPGFGDSPTLRDRRPTVEALADAVATWAGEGVDVAGNSLGGGIALELARRGWATSACAFSPIGFEAGWEDAYSRRSLKVNRAAAAALYGQWDRVHAFAPLRRALLNQGPDRGDRLTREQAAGLSRGVALAPGWDATLDAAIGWKYPGGDPPVPVTIAWGARDRLLLPRQAARARQVLPGARHVRLERCGHVPFVDDPERCADVILTTPGT